MGARAALAVDPSHWFDPAAYNAALRQLFGADYGYHIWSYPPHLLLFTWPLGLLPYASAYVAWSVLGLLAYLIVAADERREPLHLALLVLAPAVTVNLAFGQIGFVIAALMIGGLLQFGPAADPGRHSVWGADGEATHRPDAPDRAGPDRPLAGYRSRRHDLSGARSTDG